MPISGVRGIYDLLPHDNYQWVEHRPVEGITEIVVHYDAVPCPDRYDPIERYRSEAQYHIDKVWGYTEEGAPIYGFGLMYHIKIDRWGRKYKAWPFDVVLWHARAANYDGLAICLDLGPGQVPPPAQLKALQEVLQDACYRSPEFPAGRANVYGHCEVRTNATECPGAILLSYVQRYRRGKW